VACVVDDVDNDDAPVAAMGCTGPDEADVTKKRDGSSSIITSLVSSSISE
jgi:hypothetical protein